jgi:hypothetical protein
VSAVGTVTRGGSRGETGEPRRVLLLSESAGLAAVLTRLLDRSDRLSRLASFHELADGSALGAADAVVLDLPPEDRGAVLEQLRRRYQGPLVVLVARGDDGGDLPPDDARTLLARPFSADDLSAALTMAAASAWNQLTPLRQPVALPPVDAATLEPPVRRARRSRLLPLLVWLAHGWRMRRRVRVAGFVGLAAAAFVIAFALAAQGRCGPGCDLVGTGVAPVRPLPADPAASPTTGKPRKAPGSTAAPARVPAGGGEFRGRSAPVVGATSTTDRRVPATTRASGGGTTPRPPTTRPPATPPTTQPEPPTTPPTTQPEPPTTPPTTAGP